MVWYLIDNKNSRSDLLVTITDMEYKTFANLREILFLELLSEEMLDVVLSNYEDFCREIISIGNQFVIRSKAGSNYSVSSRIRTIMNKITLNVLASCNSYLDFRNNEYTRIFGQDSSEYKSYKTSTSKQYDSNFEYRICYKLRNYFVHCGFAITYHNMVLQKQDINNNENTINFKPCIEKNRLLRHKRSWNNKTLEDLNKCNDYIEIYPLITRYVSCIMEINFNLRTLTSNKVIELEKMCFDWTKGLSADSQYYLANKHHSEVITGTKREELWVPIDALKRLDELKKINIGEGKFNTVSNISMLTPFVKTQLKNVQNHKRDKSLE